MTQLSVNVNKLATLRNARGKNNPNVVECARDIVAFGAHGITVHPRPDERHIRRSDVRELKKAITDELAIELNVEGYPNEDFLALIEEVVPAQCTLVPDPPEAITSNAGWDVGRHKQLLSQVIKRIKAKGTRVSVFVDPATTEESDYASLKEMGCDRVELYTELFAETYGTERQAAVLASYKLAAERSRAHGLGVNAGHDLNLDNLTQLVREIPWINEVSIGHALVCDALYFGLQSTVRRYLDCLDAGRKASDGVSTSR